MKISVKFDASACILAALLLLTLPLKWLLAAVFAAIFHELCHILVIKLMGGQIWEIRIGVGGAVIVTDILSQGKEFACAIAGPTGSLLLLLFCRWIPRTALCAAAQALFNLLPLFPLDGGRMLRCAAELLLPGKWAGNFCRFTERFTILGILVIALIATFWFHFGLFPLILASVLLMKAVSRKIPCKEAKLGVQ